MVLATVLALSSAGLHAGWNLVLKTAPAADRQLTSWAIMLAGGVVALPAIALTGGPGTAALPWLGLSGLVHVAYISALVAAYDHGDFSLAYPLARGGGALLAALGGVAFLGDRLPPVAWGAIAVAAVGLISLVGRAVSPSAVRASLLTALAIGAYTVIDSHGSRVSADGLAYGLSSSAATAATVSVLFLARGRGRDLLAAADGSWWRWSSAGAASVVAYGMVMVAVRHAPVGYVAMLRESSVVLGALAGWQFLREPLGGRRLLSSCVILAGLLALVAVTV